jgi:NAD(P)-dependent dehydrogenase (short-subunit alcohol dehydrogenase family)
MNDVKPRTALVTGASTGIGRGGGLGGAPAGGDLWGGRH